MSPAKKGKQPDADEPLQRALDVLREDIARGFTLTADRLQASFDDSVRRGRITRSDAEELASRLIEQGRRQRQDLLAEVERLFGRAGGGIAGAGRRAMESVEATASAARRVAGLHRFPIGGYDELIVSQVVSKLDALDQSELRTVRDYERGNANRKSVLGAIDKRLD
ncbi:MAG: hypothetical protein ACR2ND_02000 [Solirubrobacteraceae bacterium]